MVRIIIKGGVWKNTEDEVLKAAVMKYGKNQWARISSLLTRKTPKQCKARWFEWLDPSIKKIEWSKEEDEKLLHMAKLMPTQWRTIAPIVGRTPAQCLERYQRLLDEAELGDEAGPSSDDVRKLRPGEIDPDPESKPARPDPVDMDEDEKEMLSEARARLANTQGKKAKRKAREKQLAESRRVSQLQKRRELKNAGIEIKQKKKGRGMDYNADIPFHKPQPAGFWDVNAERAREQAEKRDLSNALLETLEGKRRIEVEMDERKKDFKKQKVKKDLGADDETQRMQAAVDPDLVTPRRKLVLPAPQVTEADLEDIVKMGVSGESARMMVQAGNETPASNFVAPASKYSQFNIPIAARTPRVMTESGGDYLKSMARDLKSISTSQTPLLGDDVILETDMAFSATPGPSIAAQTPNALLGKMTPLGFGGANTRGGATPSGNGSMMRSVTRDAMGINTPMVGGFSDTPRGSVASASSTGAPLSSLFSSLPAPKNDFEIVIPEDELELEEEQDIMREQDQEIINARNRAAEEAEKERLLKLRSKVIQKHLPRPLITMESIALLYNSSASESDEIDAMIKKEKAVLLYNDACSYPFQEQEALPNDKYILDKLDGYLEQAGNIIRKEVDDEKEMRQEIMGEIVCQDYEFDNGTGDYIGIDQMTLTNYKEQHAGLFELMKGQARISQKSEKKLSVLLGGYMVRRKALERTFTSTLKELEDLRIDLFVFKQLAQKEEGLVAVRLQDERKELQRVSMIEQDLQDRYRELVVYERDSFNPAR